MSDEAHAEIEVQAPQKWDAPPIDGADDEKGFLTAGRLQDIQKQAHDEAWQEGHAEGIQAGAAESEKRAERLDQLLRSLARPFDLLDETVEKELVELSMTVVKHLFRRELQVDPSHVIGVVREAIQAMPIASRDICVHLHPEDAQLVQETLSTTDGERAWSIVEDPLIEPGGCTVNSENSRIDAQAQTRLDAIISRVVGDERQ